MLNQEERVVYETRIQSLANVESKIALTMPSKGIDIATGVEVTGLVKCDIQEPLTIKDE